MTTPADTRKILFDAQVREIERLEAERDRLQMEVEKLTRQRADWKAVAEQATEQRQDARRDRDRLAEALREVLKYVWHDESLEAQEVVRTARVALAALEEK